MASIVTYKGPRDRRDGSTEVEVEVEGTRYVFPQGRPGGEVGKDAGPVPDAVRERLEAPDLKGHEFSFDDEAGDRAVGFHAMTVTQLKELAAANGVEVATDARKPDLIAALDESDVEPPSES